MAGTFNEWLSRRHGWGFYRIFASSGLGAPMAVYGASCRCLSGGNGFSVGGSLGGVGRVSRQQGRYESYDGL